MVEKIEQTGLAYLEGVLCWPDGNVQTPFKKEVELRLYEVSTLDPTKEGRLLTWDDIKDTEFLASTKTDKNTGYFWFHKSDKEDEFLDVLGEKDEREFWIASANCIILTPWGNDKVINIRGGGVLKIKVKKETKEGKRGKKIVSYVWSCQRYPGPEVKDWSESHMLKIQIPGEEPKTERLVKAFYVIPIANYKEDGTCDLEGFELRDEIKLMFNPSTNEVLPIYPASVLDCSEYSEKADSIYKSAVVDFYAFGAKYDGQENKLRKFAYKQDGSCPQVPFGKAVCYKDEKNRIKNFEYAHDSSETSKLTFYSPFKPQFTENTPAFDIDTPLPQYDSSFKPNDVLYNPLEHISGAILDGNALRSYTLRDIGKLKPGTGHDPNSDHFSHEYFAKGFTPGRFKDRRGSPGSYRMHWGLDIHNWLTTTGSKGPPAHAMCYGRFVTGNDPDGAGKIISLEIKFPDGKSGKIQHFHTHSYNLSIEEGQFVFGGQLLGYSGDDGNADGDPKTSNTTVTSKHMHTEFRVDGVRRNPAKIFLPNLEDEPTTNTQPANDNDSTLINYRKPTHPKIQGQVKEPVTGGSPALAEHAAAGAKQPAEGVSVEVRDAENDAILYSKTVTDNAGKYTVPAPPRRLTLLFKKGSRKIQRELSISLKSDEQTVEKVDVDDL